MQAYEHYEICSYIKCSLCYGNSAEFVAYLRDIWTEISDRDRKTISPDWVEQREQSAEWSW